MRNLKEKEMEDGERVDIQDCCRACSKVVQFMTDVQVPAISGTGKGVYTRIGGYRYINTFVKFNQQSSNELPVDLVVGYAFDSNREMVAGKYVNLEQNLSSQQYINVISISGDGSFNGSPPNASSYIASLPVIDLFTQVFHFNGASATRSVYLGLSNFLNRRLKSCSF
jgi:hypothetical protein